MTDNPLLVKYWKTKDQTIPFSQISPDHIGPALDVIRERIRAIIFETERQTEIHSFPSLEEESELLLLGQIASVFELMSGCMRTQRFVELEEELSQQISSFYDEILQNKRVYELLSSIPLNDKLDIHSNRLLEITLQNMRKRGAGLPKEQIDELCSINQQLTSLFVEFSRNIEIAEGKNFIIESTELDGLSETLIETLRQEDGTYAAPCDRSMMEVVNKSATNRNLRKRFYQAIYSRAEDDSSTGNVALAHKILSLRHRRAQILGFESHAHWNLSDKMAQTPNQALELVNKVYEQALKKANEEIADMQKIADKDGIQLEAWDYLFYSSKVIQEKFSYSEQEISKYFEYGNLRDAMFYMAKKLYGLDFQLATDVDVYHESVECYRVFEHDKLVAYFYLDPFKRDEMRPGAWEHAYRFQGSFEGNILPLVANVLQLNKGKRRTEVSLLDANTMFHEFGHALADILSKCRYPEISGNNVPWDFVEMSSQIHENWLFSKEIMETFLKDENGNPIPPELVDKVIDSAKFGSGFSFIEMLAASIFDMRMHLPEAVGVNLHQFEQQILKELKMPPQIQMRHRFPHFHHAFASDDYSAGYYSYVWAEVIACDAFGAFKEGDGMFDANVAKRLHDSVLSQGNTIPPMAAFVQFRGRMPEINHFLEQKGLI